MPQVLPLIRRMVISSYHLRMLLQFIMTWENLMIPTKRSFMGRKKAICQLIIAMQGQLTFCK
jgi:hypothetical protein